MIKILALIGQDLFTILHLNRVHDDLHVQLLLAHHSLDCAQLDPEVVCVEHVELFDRLEIIFVFLGHLSHLEQAQLEILASNL